MQQDSHRKLSEHIDVSMLMPEVRKSWRSSYYWDAVNTHHKYCNDRLALIKMANDFHDRLEEDMSFFSGNEPAIILDMGCGRGEVSSALLANIPGNTYPIYYGADKDDEVFKDAREKIREQPLKAEIHFLACDYRSSDWAGSLLNVIKPASLVWLIHSAYYLESDHPVFLRNLSKMMSSKGMAIFFHNREGNAPYLKAAKALGMITHCIPFQRKIQPPQISEQEFDLLKTFPYEQKDFVKEYPGNNKLHDFRLLLEFYLYEYPLSALSAKDRELYVDNWQKHLKANEGCFRNDHEMLVILPDHVNGDFSQQIDEVVKKIQ